MQQPKLNSSTVPPTLSKNPPSLKWLVLAQTTLSILFVAGVYLAQRSYAPPANNDTDKSSPVGWLSVMGAICIFGSYGILIKSPELASAKVNNVTFQLYYSLGVTLSSLLVLSYTPFVWSWYGVVGAGVWTGCSLFAYWAINHLGYAPALAIWAGLTIVVSFLWGTLIFDQTVSNLGGAILGLLVLIGGVACVAVSQTRIPNKLQYWVLNQESKDSPREHHHLMKGADVEANHPSHSGDDSGDRNQPNKIFGFVCAVMVGLLNGSQMAPFHYFQDQQPDSSGSAAIAYLGSFALGVMMVAVACFLVYVMFILRGLPNLQFRVAFTPGLLTGLVGAARLLACLTDWIDWID